MKKSILLILSLTLISALKAQSAKDIIIKADQKWQGLSQISSMEMTIVRPTWERTIAFKGWTKGRDYSLTLITAPAREKGQTFLKRQNEMWTWNPSINRLIKLPAAMMSQGWMGSDFTNDDILKESSIVVDYTHKIIGKEEINGIMCHKIELIPTEEAAVVWGKIIKWISIDETDQIKNEYYDEDEMLVKTDIASDIKLMGDRKIPTRIEVIPADKPGNKTIVIITNIKYNVKMDNSFFSQQNMKKLK
ncbi:MAG: outer membrane lipoprotein-sorting protein [Bacteroidales bacterium]|nr:outer membrane lipoprotein-sorting protein [Bacteroidales bacterium]